MWEYSKKFKIPGDSKTYKGYTSERTFADLFDLWKQPLPKEHAQLEHHGKQNFEKFRPLLVNGWPEGVKQLQPLMLELSGQIPTMRSKKRVPVWADQGAVLDIDRGMRGQWDSAYRTAKRQVRSSINEVELLVNWDAAYGQSVYWNGAAAIVACDALETAGYRVRLVTATNTFGDDYISVSSVRCVVKEAGEALRADAVAALMCHEQSWGTVGLRNIVYSPFDFYGYGSATYWSGVKQGFEKAGMWPDETSTIIMERCHSREGAIEEVKRVLGWVEKGAPGSFLDQDS